VPVTSVGILQMHFLPSKANPRRLGRVQVTYTRSLHGRDLEKRKGVYKGRKKALKTEEAVALREMAEAEIPMAALARTYGISRETVYAYLRTTG